MIHIQVVLIEAKEKQGEKKLFFCFVLKVSTTRHNAGQHSTLNDFFYPKKISNRGKIIKVLLLYKHVFEKYKKKNCVLLLSVLKKNENIRERIGFFFSLLLCVFCYKASSSYPVCTVIISNLNFVSVFYLLAIFAHIF